jgi:hypothetical protein
VVGFQKRRVKSSLFTCESNLLIEPDKYIAKLDYKNRDGEVRKRSNLQVIESHYYYHELDCEVRS